VSVRLKIALTIVATGLVTAALVIATVLYAFQRFEREVSFQRASAFLMRVSMTYADVLERRRSEPPAAFNAWLRNLVLYEPDTQLYVLDPQGTVLASSGSARLPPGFRVSLAPVLAAMQSARESPGRTPFVMGDDPERMDADAVVAAEPLPGGGDGAAAGYLYLVAHRDRDARWMALRSSFALPSLVLIALIVGFATVLATLVIASITRPLQQLTAAVSTLSERGLEEGRTDASVTLPRAGRDELGRLAAAFEMMLATLRRQWDALRRLDRFRREGVSNLSHDLRSPLTATTACLETLDARWAADVARTEDRRLLEVALRNTRNAARLVQSLGDLAKLDEPAFRLSPVLVDVGELLDDIQLRFAERAAQRGVTLRTEAADAASPPYATLDVELFERAVANVVDNALKFCPRGSTVLLSARRAAERVEVRIADDGPGIDSADLPHLFDRYFRGRASVAPATGDGGQGLGLAIVQRIVELHGGEVSATGARGAGTCITLRVPAAKSITP
jgi:signal transduction histidine kinase